MTALDDFLTALEQKRPDYAAQLNATAALEHHIQHAHARGWTTDQLIHEALRDHHAVHNIPALITYRMTQCAGRRPPGPRRPRPQRPPWCGTCDQDTRLILDDVTRLPTARCPRCHPLNARQEMSA